MSMKNALTATVASAFLFGFSGCAHMPETFIPAPLAAPLAKLTAPVPPQPDTDIPPCGQWSRILDKTYNDLEQDAMDKAAGDLPDIPRLWPMADTSGDIISPFGNRGNARRGHCHNGIDLKASQGTPVYCAAEGQVVFSGVQNGYGNIVVVQHHEGFETAYAHLVSRDVDKGDVLTQGQQIGCVGATGRASTAHLHYEVHYSGHPVDPFFFLPAAEGPSEMLMSSTPDE